VYDEFLGKLKTRVEKIKVGASDDPGVYMGPVINAAAFQTISGYIDAGKKEGTLLTGGDRAAADGYFLQPTVIAGVPADGKLAQEEIFGPVLAVIRASDFDQALEYANNTEFGLTGGVFSDDPAQLQKASESFHVGNLYLNRKCTGAFVGGHPFGGFNMSGTDSKAGGPDYLLLFTQAKTISEKV
jgi:1-pyrroline-5-carboxylate dehydrogenase